MATFILLSALAALGTAAPVGTASTATAPAYPTPTMSPNFRLVANVTSCDVELGIQNWALTSYHIGAGEAVAVFTSNDTAGRAFYVGGTPVDVDNGTAQIFSDGGTPPFPEGFVIPSANETDGEGRRTVQINTGNGTPGVAIADPYSVPILTYDDVADANDFGGWYACNTTLPYGPAIALYYQSRGGATPSGCADLTLLPQWYAHPIFT